MGIWVPRLLTGRPFSLADLDETGRRDRARYSTLAMSGFPETHLLVMNQVMTEESVGRLGRPENGHRERTKLTAADLVLHLP